MNFSFFSPVKIIFGTGTSKNITNYIAGLPASLRKNALLVTGKNSAKSEHIINALKSSGFNCQITVQSGEPTINDVAAKVETARKFNSDFIIAVGGGSVIDAAKAAAILATNTDDIMEYLEIIGKGSPITNKPLPMIAVPTTAGTGAEATCNAVLSSFEHKVKVSLRSSLMYPHIAVIDPELTISMSCKTTACTGMDALTQLIESFTSKYAAPITDALCIEGILRIKRSLKNAFSEPDNIKAREDMSFAAVLSGIALSNAKLGAVHGIAGPMGGFVDASHGVICAKLLKPVIEQNISALKQDCINNNNLSYLENNTLPILNKYKTIARILTNNSNSEADDIVSYIGGLTDYLKINDIEFPKIEDSQIDAIAQKSQNSSSMKGNPVTLSLEQIKNIIAYLQ